MTREDLLRRQYLGRVERAIDFIYARYDDDIGLDDIADSAAFSRFHFHRVFSGVVGETVADFLKRVRLQRAAALLADNPGLSVTEIALASGFSGPSVFARAFKERYGVTASGWRSLGREGRRRFRDGSNQGQTDSKPGQAESKGREARSGGDGYPLTNVPYGTGRKDMPKLSYKVEINDLPELTVAYARHVGSLEGIPEAFERLARWAGPRGLFALPGAKTLAVYHDTPEATEASRLRSSACLTVPPGTEVSGDVNLMTIPGGKFAVARFEIDPGQFGEAWDALMGEWFPSSGWQPDDRMCYEVYLVAPDTHPEGKFVLDICEPVRPL